jgi:hypothetical protein
MAEAQNNKSLSIPTTHQGLCLSKPGQPSTGSGFGLNND